MNKNYLIKISIALISFSTFCALGFISLSINKHISSGAFLALSLQMTILPFTFMLNLIFLFVYFKKQKNYDNNKGKTLLLQILSFLSLILLLGITLFFTLTYKKLSEKDINYTPPIVLCILILINTFFFFTFYILKVKKVQ